MKMWIVKHPQSPLNVILKTSILQTIIEFKDQGQIWEGIDICIFSYTFYVKAKVIKITFSS